MTIESHPLKPFLPSNGKILFLGSFPPPRPKWSMDFFYPNWINDFWRIMGLIFFDDRRHFEVHGEKRFDKESIVRFAEEQGLAFFDTATMVRRLKDNASDNFLEILQSTDVQSLLQQMPHCHTIVTTGGKASEQLMQHFHCTLPSIGESICIVNNNWKGTWYRMPSSSRAYPLKLEKKAEIYRLLFPPI